MVRLWIVYFFYEPQDYTPCRVGFVRAFGEDEAARLAVKAMQEHEKRINVQRAELRPGAHPPPDMILTP